MYRSGLCRCLGEKLRAVRWPIAQVVHTYVAALVPVDQALMLLDPDYRANVDIMGNDPISDLEVQQLLGGAEEAEALWDGIENERPSCVAAKAAAGAGDSAAETDEAESRAGHAGPGPAAGQAPLDPLHEMWLAQQLVDRRAEAISAFPLMQDAQASAMAPSANWPASQPSLQQPGQGPQGQAQRHGQGQEQEPGLGASWMGKQREGAQVLWSGTLNQRWPPSPVKEETGSAEASPAFHTRSMQWPAEKQGSSQSSEADPHFSSLPAGVGLGGAGPGAAGQQSQQQQQQQQLGHKPGVRTPPGSPTTPQPSSPSHLASLPRQQSLPRNSPSRLQRSVTAAELAAEGEALRSGSNVVASASAPLDTATGFVSAPANAVPGAAPSSRRNSSPTKLMGAAMPWMLGSAQDSKVRTEDSVFAMFQGTSPFSVASATARPRAKDLQQQAPVLSGRTTTAAIPAAGAEAEVHSAAAGSSSAAAAPLSVADDGTEVLPALPALRTRRGADPFSSSPGLLQALAANGSTSSLSLSSSSLAAMPRAGMSSMLAGLLGVSMSQDGAPRPLSNDSKRSSRPGSLRMGLGMVDDRAPSFRTVLSLAPLDGMGIAHQASQDCEYLAPTTNDQAHTGNLAAVLSSAWVSGGPGELPLRPIASGIAGGSDICLSPRPATPVADGSGGCNTPKALAARSPGSFPGSSLHQDEGVTLQAHRTLSLPRFSGSSIGGSAASGLFPVASESAMGGSAHRRTDGAVTFATQSDAAGLYSSPSGTSSAWGEVWASVRSLASRNLKAAAPWYPAPGSSGPSSLQHQGQQGAAGQQGPPSPWYPALGSSGPSSLQHQGHSPGQQVQVGQLSLAHHHPDPPGKNRSSLQHQGAQAATAPNSAGRSDQGAWALPPTPSHARTSSSAGSVATAPFSPTPGELDTAHVRWERDWVWELELGPERGLGW